MGGRTLVAFENTTIRQLSEETATIAEEPRRTTLHSGIYGQMGLRAINLKEKAGLEANPCLEKANHCSHICVLLYVSLVNHHSPLHIL